MKKSNLKPLVVGLVLAILAAGISSCSKPAATTTPAPAPGRPGSGAIVRSDSTITGEIVSVTAMTTGYPWQVEVKVLTSQSVDGVVNPTADKIGQTIKLVTDENAGVLKVGQKITASVKLVGDVGTPSGISMYIYYIK